MSDDQDEVIFNYNLSGSIVVPKGSTLTDTGTGVVLPNGDIIKIWEALERHPGGDVDAAEDLSFDDAMDMGVHYDGDMCRFEEA